MESGINDQPDGCRPNRREVPIPDGRAASSIWETAEACGRLRSLAEAFFALSVAPHRSCVELHFFAGSYTFIFLFEPVTRAIDGHDSSAVHVLPVPN